MGMLYVARDSKGNICEVHPMPIGEASEALPADHPEVLQFIHERWRQNELHEPTAILSGSSKTPSNC
jgi:hypothetical protein